MSPPIDELMKQEDRSMNSTISEEILPTEIWGVIGKRLKSRLDVSRFRSVCRTWRSALPAPSRFPLRVPAPPGKYIKRDFASYFISELTFYAADHLIVMFEEQYQVAKFTASALRPEWHPPNLKFELPPVSQISNLSFLSNAFHIQSAIPSDCPGKYKIGPTDVLKIAVISSNSDDFNPNYAIREGDLTAVAHLIDRKLGALRLRGGAMNNQWETGFCDSTFEDIINYNGRVYAVDRWGKVFVMDCNSLQMTQVGTGLPLTPGRVPYKWKLLHLAVSADSGHLYLIVHYPLNTNTYHHVRPKVYKLISRLSSESRIRHLNKWWPLQDDDKCCWVVNLMSNFPVPRDLLRSDDGVMKYKNLPRFCSWPEVALFPLAVGFPDTNQSPTGCCDFSCLPYFVPNLPPLTYLGLP